jgi:hypothetical protein
MVIRAAIGAALKTKWRQFMNDFQQGKKPTHAAYHIRDGKAGDGFWTRIGSAWPHKDGLGFNIQMDTVPLDGRITIRVSSEKPSA